MPIQIKRQNPREGAGGVAVKMTSPIRVLAQHACAHHGALSPQVLHIADPRARATIAETHSRRFRRDLRLSQRRGVVPAAARRVGLPSASLAAGPRCSRYRPGRLAADARDFDCDLWVKGFKKLPYHFVAFGGKPTHPLTHPMRVMRPSQDLEHENETPRPAARGATEPLPRTSRRPCAFSNVPRGSRICGHTFGFTQWSWIHHASRSHCYDFRTLRTLLL